MMKSTKILIVDDSPSVLHTLLEVLNEEYAVVTATQGSKALTLAQADLPPSLILLDVIMPGMDGYEVCLRLKGDPATQSIPVLFITSLNDTESEVRCLTVGGVDFITKPINPAVVKARVRSHLELKYHKDHLETLVTQRTQELMRTRDATVNLLASLADTRDPETGAHIKRTQNYVRLIVEELNRRGGEAYTTTPAMVEILYKSAPLHDVGKVGIPDHILLKPDKLTPKEFEIMKQHSMIGWKALRSAIQELGENFFLHVAAEIAYTHHERWDGKGYPRGLIGEAIPLSGRIMALADVYDALVSKRVYKPPFSHTKSLDIIASGRDSHFDPQVVDAFLAREQAFREIAIHFADSEEERLI